jgi:hypothetical protein
MMLGIIKTENLHQEEDIQPSVLSKMSSRFDNNPFRLSGIL